MTTIYVACGGHSGIIVSRSELRKERPAQHLLPFTLPGSRQASKELRAPPPTKHSRRSREGSRKKSLQALQRTTALGSTNRGNADRIGEEEEARNERSHETRPKRRRAISIGFRRKTSRPASPSAAGRPFSSARAASVLTWQHYQKGKRHACNQESFLHHRLHAAERDFSRDGRDE